MEVAGWLAGIGLNVATPTFDGKIYRVSRRDSRSKSAWYVGWTAPFPICVAGDWRTSEKWEYKNPDKVKISKEDRATIRTMVKSAMDEASRERERLRHNAALKAAITLRSTTAIGQHAYLERKKIGAFGIGFLDGDIYIPVRDIDGKTWGYQRLTKDGKKLFVTGQRVDGCFHQIGDKTDRLFVCEGYATGASIHMATGQAVFVAFSAGNIREVARQVRDRYPTAAITVAGDDDQWSAGNPGRTKGDEAALAAMAAAVYPVFHTQDGHPTDFNDLHVREGLEELRAQLNGGEGLEKIHVPLGVGEGGHVHLYSYVHRRVITFSSFSTSQFYNLAPRAHWEQRYPNPRGRGDVVDWESAKDDLITACNAVGPFDSQKIRGSGVWLDRGRVVVNTSREIIVDGQAIPTTRFSTNNVYVDTKNRLPKPSTRPLELDEARVLIAAATGFKWKQPKFGEYLAGWLAICRVAGALPIRPHVWLTGGSGTGKSTALDRLIRPALGVEGSRIYVQGGTTEAGIRQLIKADSLPVLFDEFETTGVATMARVSSIVELLRQSWSHTSGSIVKGGADGNASIYQLAFAALVSSIRVNLPNDADRSRFTILELVPHATDMAHWDDLERSLALITPEFGERLFSRSIKMMPVILENYRTFKKVLAPIMGQRFADQHGMLLAGYGILVSDDPISANDAATFCAGLNLGDDRAEHSTDEQECLQTILTTRIQVPGGSGAIHRTIGDALRGRANGEEPVDNWLAAVQSCGVSIDSQFLYVAVSHAALKQQVFNGTRWQNGWSKTLLRLPGAEPHQKRIGGDNGRCTRIPRNLIDN